MRVLSFADRECDLAHSKFPRDHVLVHVRYLKMHLWQVMVFWELGHGRNRGGRCGSGAAEAAFVGAALSVGWNAVFRACEVGFCSLSEPDGGVKSHVKTGGNAMVRQFHCYAQSH